MKKAVLFLIFNRFDTTQKVFEQIKKAKPPRLYVSGDGWRNSKAGEEEQVKEIRKWVLDNIDWDCEVKTNFSERNKGCGKSISEAITWFFSFEKDGIILEDDCVPAQSFFRFCEELLDKYKDEKRIWHIGGISRYQDKKAKESYFFSNATFSWGWATWADRWQSYKYDLTDYDENTFKSKHVTDTWYWIRQQLEDNKVDTWDYQWSFCVLVHDGISINPYNNLVTNIGYTGVHYNYDKKNCKDKTLGVDVQEIDTIIHPQKVEFNQEAITAMKKHLAKQKPREYVMYKHFAEYIFSVRNLGIRKVITIFGFKIKIKKSKSNQQKILEEQSK